MKFLSSASALALAFSATVAAAQDVDRTGWPASFTVGTASQGGTFFVYGSGWANLVAEELGITGAGEVTGGPMQNMALVHTGDLAFGLTTLGPAAESLAGTNPIAPGLAMDNVCAMFPMYQTPFHLADRAAAAPATPPRNRGPPVPRRRCRRSAPRSRSGCRREYSCSR
jgi:TRAP-type uncharacterized transport system substrate-binding protein